MRSILYMFYQNTLNLKYHSPTCALVGAAFLYILAFLFEELVPQSKTKRSAVLFCTFCKEVLSPRPVPGTTHLTIDTIVATLRCCPRFSGSALAISRYSS